MEEPRNKRQEKRDKNKSGRPTGAYSSKHVRMKEMLIEKRNKDCKKSK